NTQQKPLIGSSSDHRSAKKSTKNARDPGHVRRISFVFATTIWSAATVLPYRFAYIINNLPGYQATTLGVYISFCFYALMALNAAGNPFITMMTHKQYWKQIYDCFRCVWCRLSDGKDNKTIDR